jgi:hypothetical protein
MCTPSPINIEHFIFLHGIRGLGLGFFFLPSPAAAVGFLPPHSRHLPSLPPGGPAFPPGGGLPPPSSHRTPSLPWHLPCEQLLQGARSPSSRSSPPLDAAGRAAPPFVPAMVVGLPQAPLADYLEAPAPAAAQDEASRRPFVGVMTEEKARELRAWLPSLGAAAPGSDGARRGCACPLRGRAHPGPDAGNGPAEAPRVARCCGFFLRREEARKSGARSCPPKTATLSSTRPTPLRPALFPPLRRPRPLRSPSPAVAASPGGAVPHGAPEQPLCSRALSYSPSLGARAPPLQLLLVRLPLLRGPCRRPSLARRPQAAAVGPLPSPFPSCRPAPPLPWLHACRLTGRGRGPPLPGLPSRRHRIRAPLCLRR